MSPEQNPNFFPTKSRCGMNRPTTASLRSATPKEKHSLLFVFARTGFFLKRKGCFSFGVLPSKYSGSVAGLQCGLGFAKLFFWEFGFGKTETEFPARRKIRYEEKSSISVNGFVLQHHPNNVHHLPAEADERLAL